MNYYSKPYDLNSLDLNHCLTQWFSNFLNLMKKPIFNFFVKILVKHCKFFQCHNKNSKAFQSTVSV